MLYLEDENGKSKYCQCEKKEKTENSTEIRFFHSGRIPPLEHCIKEKLDGTKTSNGEHAFIMKRSQTVFNLRPENQPDSQEKKREEKAREEMAGQV